MSRAIGVLVFAIVVCVCVIVKQFKFKLLYKHVAWCATKDSQQHRCGLDLCHYAINQTIKRKCKYQFTEEEVPVLKSILADYQVYIANSFFENRLNYPWRVINLPDEELFFITLQQFLCEKDVYYTSENHAIVYYKLRVVSEMVCEETGLTRFIQSKFTQQTLQKIIEEKNRRNEQNYGT